MQTATKTVANSHFLLLKEALLQLISALAKYQGSFAEEELGNISSNSENFSINLAHKQLKER